jgi:hypothetical protein
MRIRSIELTGERKNVLNHVISAVIRKRGADLMFQAISTDDRINSPIPANQHHISTSNNSDVNYGPSYVP